MSTQAHELPDTGRLEIDDAKERLRQVLRQYRRKHHSLATGMIADIQQGHNPQCWQGILL